MIKTPVLAYLLQFLTQKDHFECNRVNVSFRNSFVYLYRSWINQLDDLKRDYHLTIPLSEIDYSRDIASKVKRTYRMNDLKGGYVEIQPKGEKIYSLFNAFTWPWYDHPGYWDPIHYPDSLFGGPSYSLTWVTWISIRTFIPHVKADNYKLYIRHGIEQLNINSIIINVSVDTNEICQLKYPTEEMKNQYKKEVGFLKIGIKTPNTIFHRHRSNPKTNIREINLMDTWLMNISKSQFQVKENDNDHKLNFFFTYREEFESKNGWILDAMYIVKDS